MKPLIVPNVVFGNFGKPKEISSVGISAGLSHLAADNLDFVFLQCRRGVRGDANEHSGVSGAVDLNVGLQLEIRKLLLGYQGAVSFPVAIDRASGDK